MLKKAINNQWIIIYKNVPGFLPIALDQILIIWNLRNKSILLSTIWPIKSDQSCVIWSFHGVFARSFSDSTYLAREMIEKKLARPWKKSLLYPRKLRPSHRKLFHIVKVVRKKGTVGKIWKKQNKQKISQMN